MQYSAVVCASECGSEGRKFKSRQNKTRVVSFGHDRLVTRASSAMVPTGMKDRIKSCNFTDVSFVRLLIKVPDEHRVPGSG